MSLVLQLIFPSRIFIFVAFRFVMKNILLIFTLLLLNVSYGQNDSLIRSAWFGYFMLNDDNPISNQKDYEDRRRDDHGLTMSIGLEMGMELQFSENWTSEFSFVIANSLYTKGLGTTTTLMEEDPYYDDYSYLLEKHKDWTNPHVNDQIAYSRNIEELEWLNCWKERFLGGLGLRHSKIDVDEDQFMTDVQRNFHRILNARNYFHVPFVGESSFGENDISFYSWAPLLGAKAEWELSEKIRFNGWIKTGAWFNYVGHQDIPEISPFGDARLNFYMPIKEEDVARLELYYQMHYEPEEIVQMYSNPGTNGYQNIGINYNFSNVRKTEKSYYFIISVSPYEVYLPLGKKTDVTFDYVPPEDDLKFVEGFFNSSVIFVFH